MIIAKKRTAQRKVNIFKFDILKFDNILFGNLAFGSLAFDIESQSRYDVHSSAPTCKALRGLAMFAMFYFYK
jgi:hypothetical protein